MRSWRWRCLIKLVILLLIGGLVVITTVITATRSATRATSRRRFLVLPHGELVLREVLARVIAIIISRTFAIRRITFSSGCQLPRS